jgi:hypothetical protein
MIACDTRQFPIEDVRDPRVFAVNTSTTRTKFIDYAWRDGTVRAVLEPGQVEELPEDCNFRVGTVAGERVIWIDAQASPGVVVELRSKPPEAAWRSS